MITTPVQLRFSDFDMGGHVHNAMYLNYFEVGRVGFFTTTLGKKWNYKKDGLIVKKNVIEYHIPIFIEDEIKVEVGCSHIGNTSFTLTYKVIDHAGRIKAAGESVIVSFDYNLNQTTKISKKMRDVLEAHLI
ncbi:acyl-CoA thioesterase [Crocinitomix algicola]|uniref:acyl-CoA thioesterase n=1 Tax=Crocinitomix algicola TaxID=1740263 RepID=UPI0008313C3E|nr:acyl-CoA thioesterase [Crocinitomix algicola]